MKKEESLELTAQIAQRIAQRAPRIVYTPKDLKNARETYSNEKLRELAELGFYHGDFEQFFVMKCFCDGMDLWKRADEGYLRALFSQGRRLDRAEFYQDPYLSQIHIQERQLGEILLTECYYERGEFFQYDMPDLSADVVVPKLGFFSQKVAFPAVYEGRIPWVSVCPSEIHSMMPDVPAAHGRVLVLGLGLGYYPFCISASQDVKSITVVEKNPKILRLFREEILPQFPQKEKIFLVEADAFEFLEECGKEDYDFCYADIWEGWEDGSVCYQKIFPYEKRLKNTEFRYWIGDEILWYLKNA